MILEILPVGALQANCSVVGDEASKEALVADPGGDMKRIQATVERHGLRVTTIVLTHAHLDHVGAAMELKRATGARLLMSPNDLRLLEALPEQAQWLGMRDPGEMVLDGELKADDVLKVGTMEAKIMATPGHTEGSVCLYFAKEKLLIAGDLLFAGSIGRTDLPGGSTEKILHSLAEVAKLPDDVNVVTGHGPATTIGEEKRGNPYLR